MSSKSPCLAAALAYAERGWFVNPINPNTKECAFQGVSVEEHASRDPAQVSEWWREDLRRNVGLVPGTASGFVVVDIDVKNGADGLGLLEHLEKKVGKLPSTWRERTWSGGEHLYFQHPGDTVDGVRLSNVKGGDVLRKLRGIEFYATPSNIVAAPSVVESKPYVVIDEANLAPLPDEFMSLWLHLLTERPKVGRDRKIPEGDRDWQVFCEACRLYQEFGDDGLEEARAALQDFNQQCCEEPLPKRQVDKCLRSAWRRRGSRSKASAQRVDIVEQVNAEHALVFVGDKIGVLWPNKYNRGEGMPRITKLSDLSIEWADRMVGKLNPVKIWLESPNRRKYEEMVFRPGVTDTGNDFNFWRGWPVAPVKGDCHLFLAHLREIICGGDEVAYRYFLDWFANIFQEPENKPGTAIGLGSIEGTGKGALIEYIRPLLEPHFWHMSGSSLLDGNFNDFLAGRLLVYGDEALWAGRKSTIAKIKGYITERRIAVERKCVPAFQIDLHARFIFASNEEHFAPAGRTDRRFVPLEPKAMRRDDIPYFEALDREAKSGGREALMWMLVNEVDGSTNHLRVVPKTKAHTEQKLLDLGGAGEFWRWMLYQKHREILRGYGDNTEVEHSLTFGSVVHTDTLYAFYRQYARDSRINHTVSIDALGMALRRFITLTKREARRSEKTELGRSPGERFQVYELPTLAEARRQFRKAVGEHVEWSTPDEDEDDEIDADAKIEIDPLLCYQGDWEAYLRSMDIEPDDWKRKRRPVLERVVGATTF